MVRVQQDNVPPDSIATFTVTVPARTVPADAIFTAIPGPAGPFALTRPAIAALAGLVVVAAALAGWVVVARRRDTHAAETSVNPIDPWFATTQGRISLRRTGCFPGR